ncbi:unnamed protein product, partial [marine sediment metagenome]
TRGLNFSEEILIAREAITEMEHLSACEVVVTERPNFRSSWQDGKTAYDLDTDSAKKAVDEIEEIINLI